VVIDGWVQRSNGNHFGPSQLTPALPSSPSTTTTLLPTLTIPFSPPHLTSTPPPPDHMVGMPFAPPVQRSVPSNTDDCLSSLGLPPGVIESIYQCAEGDEGQQLMGMSVKRTIDMCGTHESR